MHGSKLSHRVLGAHYDDLLNIRNNWMKNIVWRAAFSGYSFLLLKKSIWLEGNRVKSGKEACKRQRMLFMPLRARYPYRLSHRIPSMRFTFYQQPQKVNKKGRSPIQCSSSTNLLILVGRNNSLLTSYFSIAYPCD